MAPRPSHLPHDALEKAILSDMRMHSACPLDCPDSCSLTVTIDDGRVTRIDGDKRNPYTQGFICSKVHAFPERVYGRFRVLKPLLRNGPRGSGNFTEVSWTHALDLIVNRMKEAIARHGAHSILPVSYGGSNGMLSHQAADHRFFTRLGASRLARTVCAAPSGRAAAGLYGKMAGVPLSAYRQSRLIVVWGANPSVSGIHLIPIIRDAQKRGSKLIVVDPRRTPLAKKADLHIAPQPGTDLPIALSLIRELFQKKRADFDFLDQHCSGVETLQERAAAWDFARAARIAGVSAESLEKCFELYSSLSPAVIRCGWGVERNRNGGSAVAAILALPAVAGKFGIPGGGYTMSNSGAWKLGTPGPSEDDTAPLINMNRLGCTLGDPASSIHFIFVYNCNPLATLPNQEKVRRGLLREDLFSVVFDQVMTDTARFADVVLPATTFLEHDDLLRGYGATVLHRIHPVIDPVGESRSNFQVFGELSVRMGLESCMSGEEECIREILAPVSGSQAAANLTQSGIALQEYPSEPVQFKDIFPATSDHRVHLVPEELDREAPRGLYGYQEDSCSGEFPLALLSPATNRTISSSLGELHEPQVSLQMYPQDADSRGIRDGNAVRVYNDLGEVHCHAALSWDLRPGTVVLPKGLWSHHTSNGATANALAPDTLADLGGGACFNDARVQVSKHQI